MAETKNNFVKDTLLPAAPFLLMGFVAFKLLNKFLGNPNASHDQNLENTVNSVPAPVVSKMTFTLARAKVLADQLEHAMRRSTWLTADMDGTDEDAIYKVFAEIKNPEDMKAVYKAFAVRVYTHGYFSNVVKLDLIGMLQAELSDSEMAKIYNKLKWVA